MNMNTVLCLFTIISGSHSGKVGVWGERVEDAENMFYDVVAFLVAIRALTQKCFPLTGTGGPLLSPRLLWVDTATGRLAHRTMVSKSCMVVTPSSMIGLLLDDTVRHSFMFIP